MSRHAWTQGGERGGAGTLIFDAFVSLPHLAAAAAGLAAAVFGAFACASLCLYSPTRLQARSADDRSRARAEDLQQHETEYAVLAGILALAGTAVAVLAVHGGVDVETRPWALAALAAVIVVFAVTLPAAVAKVRAEATVVRSLPALRVLRFVFRWPLVLPVLAVTRSALRVLRIREEPATDPAEVTEQVLAAVSDSVAEDALPAEEKTWIGNILSLRDQQVSAAMTPRTDIIAVPAELPLEQAVQLALLHGFSRYPVYRERVDEIVGAFYVKDALRIAFGGKPDAGKEPVRTMMREPLFVPETMNCAQLLRKFQTGKLHMAIVLDEYGGTAGLVSVEDLLELIVGDIADEYDAADTVAEAEEKVQVVEPGRVLELPGRTSVEDVNRLLVTAIRDDGDWDTIAGYVIAQCNRIPAVGEAFQFDGVEFRVLKADDRKLSRLRITALQEQAAGEGAA